jgi:acetylornithine/succinyldiaminopimelate/putrescine aminotransferase
VRELCTDKGVLLCFDEVQTGMGRTGSFLACQRLGVTPDIVAMAKGLGGGFPIGAMAAKAAVMGAFQPGDHASTFGGNPLACAAANAALNVLKEEKLVERAAENGEWALKEMDAIRTRHAGLVREVRGLGLMLGMEMASEEVARKVSDHCMDERILVNRTAGSVIRLVPPLCITKEELSQALSAIEGALA